MFRILAVTFTLTACHLLCARAASLRMRTAPETGEQTAADDDKELSREKRMTVDLVVRLWNNFLSEHERFDVHF